MPMFGDEKPAVQTQPSTMDDQIKAVELAIARKRLKIAEQELIEFEEKEANKAQVTRIRVEAMAKEAEEHQRRQNACKHLTGGKGKPGFLNGDGRHGHSVAHMVLPTGELYVMCIRCQKEWHHPNWTVKLEIFNQILQGLPPKTTMTKSKYDKQLSEYAQAVEWGHELTETAEASRFTIPLLDRIDVGNIQLAKEEVNV